jgi:hypothetical protein
VCRHKVRNLLPSENLHGRRVMRGKPRKCLWIFASHGSAVPGQEAGALPKQIVGLAGGEGVDVTQPAASLREGEMGKKAERRIDGCEGSGRYDIADGEEDVNWEREQGRRHLEWVATTSTLNDGKRRGRKLCYKRNDEGP